jgi:hypothetical protein
MRYQKMKPMSVHDHHDVTDEDVQAALYGDDYHYWHDVSTSHAPRMSPINRLSASMTPAQRNAVVNGDLVITPEMLKPFE